MEKARKLIVDLVENTFDSVVKEDSEYKELESQKNEILKKLKQNLSDQDFQEVEKLLDCLDGQNFITAMGFSFVRVLDLEKLLVERI